MSLPGTPAFLHNFSLIGRRNQRRVDSYGFQPVGCISPVSLIGRSPQFWLLCVRSLILAVNLLSPDVLFCVWCVSECLSFVLCDHWGPLSKRVRQRLDSASLSTFPHSSNHLIRAVFDEGAEWRCFWEPPRRGGSLLSAAD